MRCIYIVSLICGILAGEYTAYMRLPLVKRAEAHNDCHSAQLSVEADMGVLVRTSSLSHSAACCGKIIVVLMLVSTLCVYHLSLTIIARALFASHEPTLGVSNLNSHDGEAQYLYAARRSRAGRQPTLEETSPHKLRFVHRSIRLRRPSADAQMRSGVQRVCDHCPGAST